MESTADANLPSPQSLPTPTGTADADANSHPSLETHDTTQEADTQEAGATASPTDPATTDTPEDSSGGAAGDPLPHHSEVSLDAADNTPATTSPTDNPALPAHDTSTGDSEEAKWDWKAPPEMPTPSHDSDASPDVVKHHGRSRETDTQPSESAPTAKPRRNSPSRWIHSTKPTPQSTPRARPAPAPHEDQKVECSATRCAVFDEDPVSHVIDVPDAETARAARRGPPKRSGRLFTFRGRTFLTRPEFVDGERVEMPSEGRIGTVEKYMGMSARIKWDGETTAKPYKRRWYDSIAVLSQRLFGFRMGELVDYVREQRADVVTITDIELVGGPPSYPDTAVTVSIPPRGGATEPTTETVVMSRRSTGVLLPRELAEGARVQAVKPLTTPDGQQVPFGSAGRISAIITEQRWFLGNEKEPDRHFVKKMGDNSVISYEVVFETLGTSVTCYRDELARVPKPLRRPVRRKKR